MKPRHLVWTLAGTTMLLALVTTGLGWVDDGTRLPREEGSGTVDFIFELAFSLMALTFAALGALLAARRPRNPIGWILTVASCSLGVSGVSRGWYRHAYYADPGSPLPPDALMWVASWIWVLGFVPLVTSLLLLFPDGRLPSRRWLPVGVIVWSSLAAMILGYAFEAGRMSDFPRIENPLGAGGSVARAVELLKEVGSAGYLLATVASVAALVSRFRHSVGQERQQLKWVAAAAALTLCVLVANIVLDEAFGFNGGWFLFQLLLTAIPAAATVAILRYRLYDLGRIVNRALVYAGLTATLGGAYLGLVLLAGLAVGESDLAIAGSTLAVAALFRPARARIQALVDRRFYRRRYDAAHTLEAFAARLRDEIDLDALGVHLRGAARDTVQPAHVSLWLRSPR